MRWIVHKDNQSFSVEAERFQVDGARYIFYDNHNHPVGVFPMGSLIHQDTSPKISPPQKTRAYLDEEPTPTGKNCFDCHLALTTGSLTAKGTGIIKDVPNGRVYCPECWEARKKEDEPLLDSVAPHEPTPNRRTSIVDIPEEEHGKCKKCGRPSGIKSDVIRCLVCTPMSEREESDGDNKA